MAWNSIGRNFLSTSRGLQKATLELDLPITSAQIFPYDCSSLWRNQIMDYSGESYKGN